jgi:hypothetical protein
LLQTPQAAASFSKGGTNPACENIVYDKRHDITYDIIYDIGILNIGYDIGYDITYDISIFNIRYDIIYNIRYDIRILVYITCQVLPQLQHEKECLVVEVISFKIHFLFF